LIVLDTHAWISWHSDPERLSSAAREAIDETDRVGVSVFSAWEVAMLAQRGRALPDRDIDTWVSQALAHPRSVTMPLTPAIAVRAGSLESDNLRDPADRIIYATAREAGVRLITRDRAMHRFDAARAVW
jgi:PIN domain nuclease of toxin-antitoxin system